jgi:hypothetical protein
VYLLDCTIALFSTTAHHRHSNLPRYAPKQKSSPWVVTGKGYWNIKTNKQGSAIKLQPIHSLKTIKKS